MINKKDNFIINDQNMFQSLYNVKEFLVENEILHQTKRCVKCNSDSMLIIYKENGNERLLYRCKKRDCQNKSVILKGTKMILNEYLHLIYLIFINCNYYQISLLTGRSSGTIASAKKKLRDIFKVINKEQFTLLGGLGKIVEIDETVLCRRGIIRYPTSTEDLCFDTVWILGIIDRNTNNFYVKRIKDRKIKTISEVLEEIVGIGSILYSDGYPSYPSVADNLHLIHHVVNHSEGFKAPDGTHTNTIEGLWSVMKSEMTKQHGVKRCDIDIWLEEFMFRKRNLDNYDNDNMKNNFINILKNIFK